MNMHKAKRYFVMLHFKNSFKCQIINTPISGYFVETVIVFGPKSLTHDDAKSYGKNMINFTLPSPKKKMLIL